MSKIKKQNKKEVIEENGQEEHQFVKKDLKKGVLEKNDKNKLNKKDLPKEDGDLLELKIDKSDEKEDVFDEKKIDKKLLEIYENPDGSLPDMTHFQKVKRDRLARAMAVLLFACLFLAAVAWVGFFVLQPKSSFSEKDVILSISGEEVVKVGEELRYRIRYRNDQNVDLTNVLLQVRYPEGFVLTDASLNPTNENKDEWLLGSLGARESGFVDIFGKMYGNVGQKQSFRVFLNYVAVNFSSEFQKVANTTVEIIEAPFDLSVEGPEEVVLGSDVELIIIVDNKENIDKANLALEIESNGIFSIKSSEPKQDQFVENRWSLISLGDGNKFVIHGVFDPDTLAEAGNVEIKLVGWKGTDRSMDGYVYLNKTYTVNFLQKEVSANLVINGSTSNFTVQPGEVLNGTVILKNAGEMPLKKVIARVVLDAPSYDKKSILDWTKLENPQDADIFGEQLNTAKRRGTLAWNRYKIRDLLQVDPNEEIIADFSLPIKNADDEDLTVYTDFVIEAVLELRYELNGKEEIISTSPIVMTLNSDTDFEVRDELSLFDEKEKHKMTWVVTNSFHELDNIRLEADLYGDITWDDSVFEAPAGVAEFDEDSQKIVWTIEKMPLGLDVLALPFAFTLNEKNPTQTNLTSKVTFSATDTITGEEILLVGKEILLNGE